MDAGYALLVEEYSRVGVPLLEAIEQTSNLRAGGASTPPLEEASEEELAKQNEASMRQLQQMMGGLGT